MKNLKKLVIASFMLVIAFVAVVSSTYAWFTQSSDATVNQISIGVVDANKSLLVSKNADADGISEQVIWGKAVSFSYAGKMTPATLYTNNNTSEIKVKGLEFDDNLMPYYVDLPALSEGDATATTEKGYIKFDLWFQIDVNEHEDLANTKIKLELKNLHAYDVNNGVVDTTKTNERALSSFRMAVVSETLVTSEGENPTTSHNFKVEKMIEGVSSSYTGEYGSGPQFDSSNAWMQKYAAASTNYTYTHMVQDPENEGQTINELANLAAENKGAFTQANAGSAYTLVRSDAAYASALHVSDQADGTAEYDIVDFYGGDAMSYGTAIGETATQAWAHIVIYVWMEGWDGDCVNAASGCEYRFTMSFAVANIQ